MSAACSERKEYPAEAVPAGESIRGHQQQQPDRHQKAYTRAQSGINAYAPLHGEREDTYRELSDIDEELGQKEQELG